MLIDSIEQSSVIDRSDNLIVMENHCRYLIIISAWSVEFTSINYQLIIKLVVQCANVFNLLRKKQDSHRLAVAKLLDR